MRWITHQEDVISRSTFGELVEAGKIDEVLGKPSTDLQFTFRSLHGRDRTMWDLGRCRG
jgi:hypothetical protein